MGKIDLDNPYQTLVNFDGLYDSPKDVNGKPKGPVVAYAGIESETQKNYVGFAYFNIAKVEQDPKSRKYFVEALARNIKYRVNHPTIIVGAPMGGLILATALADAFFCDVAFFEKKVTKLADPINHLKEESELVFNRHEINPGDSVILFEDLVNNFSTTKKMVDFIDSKGANVIAIACIVNRSPNGCDSFEGIPVISVIDIPTAEYKQTDPEVKELIESGNIVYKPKAEWSRLKKAMEDENK
jgi:orotate phosphoribosyltransferase